jgi:hypothetical protein
MRTEIEPDDVEAPEGPAEPAADADAPKVVRTGRPGRPKGYGKTGGRQKGVPTKAQTAEGIRQQLVAKSPKVIARLCAIACGEPVTCAGATGKTHTRHPTLAEQVRAQELVLAKILPDLRSEEITSANVSAVVEVGEGERQSVAKALFETIYKTKDGDAVLAAVRKPSISDCVPDGVASTQIGLPAPVTPASPDTPAPGSADAVDAPAPAAKPSMVGERHLVGDAGHWIQLRDIGNDGRERWALYEPNGDHLRNIWGKERAEQAALEHATTGKISG